MVVGGQCHVPAVLTPGKRPGTRCAGGWVDPRACQDGWGKPRPYLDSNSGPSSPQPVAIPTKLTWPTSIYIVITKN